MSVFMMKSRYQYVAECYLYYSLSISKVISISMAISISIPLPPAIL